MRNPSEGEGNFRPLHVYCPEENLGSHYDLEQRRAAAQVINSEAPLVVNEAANNFLPFLAQWQGKFDQGHLFRQAWQETLGWPLLISFKRLAPAETIQQWERYASRFDSSRFMTVIEQAHRVMMREVKPGYKKANLFGLEPHQWMPPGWQPIIAEYGLIHPLDSVLLDLCEHIRVKTLTYHGNPPSRFKEAEMRLLLKYHIELLTKPHSGEKTSRFEKEHDFDSGSGDTQLMIKCLGKNLALSTMATIGFSYGLIRLGHPSPYISLVDKRLKRRPVRVITQEFMEKTAKL
jgi:hypothetical protein